MPKMMIVCVMMVLACHRRPRVVSPPEPEIEPVMAEPAQPPARAEPSLPSIRYADHSFWCGDVDSVKGPRGITICGSTPELCMRGVRNFGDGKGPCVERDAMACFTWVRVVIEEKNAYCFSTMTECLAALDVLTGPDLVATSECIVLRYRR